MGGFTAIAQGAVEHYVTSARASVPSSSRERPLRPRIPPLI
jgi:hypothetical protein